MNNKKIISCPKKKKTLSLITMPHILRISFLSPAKRRVSYIQVLTVLCLQNNLSSTLFGTKKYSLNEDTQTWNNLTQRSADGIIYFKEAKKLNKSLVMIYRVVSSQLLILLDVIVNKSFKDHFKNSTENGYILELSNIHL